MIVRCSRGFVCFIWDSEFRKAGLEAFLVPGPKACCQLWVNSKDLCKYSYGILLPGLGKKKKVKGSFLHQLAPSVRHKPGICPGKGCWGSLRCGRGGTACVRAEMGFACVTECQEAILASEGDHCKSFPSVPCKCLLWNCVPQETVHAPGVMLTVNSQ